ncbi:ABC transporter [Niveomyces insectorum RCEF 264]|uniref:ABC transporter n=1 Tax=Niveomyces insectorum RCEF 264 TaxID=1081102 RepID=A0A167N1X4_9HYPO|nr:ABC transporter [Niveomyces insectorum RCEF 264]
MAASRRCKALFVAGAAAALMTNSFASASTASPALGFSSVNAMQPLSFRNDGSECPPCFNCLLPAFSCGQYAECSAYDGTCKCPPGWAGIDCLEPLCGSPARGDDRPMRGDAPACECDDGWTGINCNVCTDNRACDALLGTDDGGVCYQMGDVVKSNYQMCDVTNKQILSILDGKIPEVTFSCDRNSSECNFQFWVDQRESFFCQLHECESDAQFDDNSNNTQYRCQTVSCSCIADRMLCGENGSIDLTDYLKEEIKGPASFECAQENRGTNKCVFDEPNMNDLISSVFGDPSIFLTCRAGECLYNTEVPGYKRPVSRINTPLIAAVIAACSLFLVAVILLTWYLSRRRFRYEPVPFDDSDDESIKLMADHKPASLYFDNVSYTLNGKTLLESVQGLARPGEVMAIMGASGAGKTTFLDILARKNKRGEVSGNFYVNGEKVSDHDFRNVVGFVDQEDTMLPTLTVHETILNSALLRLPRDMTRAAKEQRVYDVEKQLGIHAIRDSLIGSEEGRGRGISGGEKRRVGIACELVTSPSILFLDEPTSGLDAYNAYNVVDCLVTLARIYKRTVIFTIHQPRSNITALFDRLVLLAQGRTVYSGPFAQCQAYFDHLGYSCPPGFNIADYLVDLTMHAGSFAPYGEEQEEEEEEEDGNDDNGNLGVPGTVGSDGASDRPSSTRAVKSIASISAASTTADEGGSGGGGGGGGAHAHGAEASSSSLSPLRPRGKRRDSVRARQERELFTRRKNTLDTTASSDAGDGEPGAYRLRNQPHSAESPHIVEDPDDLPPITIVANDLDIIINAFAQSDIAKSTHDEIRHAVSEADAANGHFVGAGVDGVGANGGGGGGGNGYAPEGPNIHLSIVGKGYARVGYFRQFVIISQRTWKNLYRNPMLMLTHYAISILLGVLSGFLFYGLTNDIAGFQNRLGLFFFVLALFGFSTLTSLSVFSSERLLFVRERANGYYSPLTYFASKVLFDILPLRILPPLLMGSIIYPMTGLVPDLEHFLVFLLVLVLFNLAASGICLFIGIVCKDGGVANLIGSLVMLFSLLFAGLLLNHDKIPPTAAWLQYLSIFHYAFEALIVNEVRLLTLIDQKYKLDITVPGSVILSSFGFDNLALWRDVVSLGVFALVFIVLAYGAMHILLVEKR